MHANTNDGQLFIPPTQDNEKYSVSVNTAAYNEYQSGLVWILARTYNVSHIHLTHVLYLLIQLFASLFSIAYFEAQLTLTTPLLRPQSKRSST